MTTTPPREVPGWDSYFMNLATEVSRRSKDPSTQHGAVLVDHRNLVVSTGYNGGCRRIHDKAVDWSRPNKYAWVIHAEENALWYARGVELEQCRLYVTGAPCSRCMLRIAHAGVDTVVYGGVGSVMVDGADWELGQEIARLANLHLRLYLSV